MQTGEKRRAAERAVREVSDGDVIGVGTGTTVDCFIEALAASSIRVAGAVPSSDATERLLREKGLPIVELNDVDFLSLYVDGADAVSADYVMIKGGGNALTREKIIAAASERFVCIVDSTKQVRSLEGLPIPIEVLPLARAAVIREIVALGGRAVWRSDAVTDNGGEIIDAVGLDLSDPEALEARLDRIPGVVECGLFAFRRADRLIVGGETGCEVIDVLG